MSGSEDAKGYNLELPEDRPARLFVLSMASMSVMYRLYTGERYKNEVLSQEVTSLSRLPRDMQTAYNRRLAAEKREYGLIDDIPSETLLKRPPNWLVVGTILLVGAGILVYAQFNQQFSVSLTTTWAANSGYIIVGVLLFLAMILLVRFRRRRRAQ